MSLKDLEAIKREFEDINRAYRQAFTDQARLELIERVKKLLATLHAIGVRGMDVRDGVLK